MNRRELIAMSLACPLAASAQPREPGRRVGLFMNFAADDPESQMRLAIFLQKMQELGWTVGRNLQIEMRWAAGNSDRLARYAQELVAFRPDVVFASGGTVVGPLQQASGTVPIVFVQVTDPVSGGYVDSLARPGRNATGFTNFDYAISAKWLELLREIAPNVKRVAVLRNLALASGSGQLGAIQGLALASGVEVTPVDIRDANEIERAVTAFARVPNGGMIVTSSTFASVHRDLIASLAARLRLPAVHAYRERANRAALLSYAPDPFDSYGRAASYIDRILKGEKPADLPVQNPTKYQLVINLTTARDLGLNVPDMLLVRADEVIE